MRPKTVTRWSLVALLVMLQACTQPGARGPAMEARRSDQAIGVPSSSPAPTSRPAQSASSSPEPTAPASASAGARRVPGTQVSLVWPDGFTRAESFTGLMLERAGASIMINEIAGPSRETMAGMTDEAMAVRAGVTVLGRSDLTVGGRDALLLDAEQSVAGTAFRKWLLMFGDDRTTIQVVATYPERLARSLSQPLKQALLSVTWDPSVAVPRYENVPYRIQPRAPLRFADRMGTTFVFNTSGEMPSADPAEPVLVVTPSLVEGTTSDAAALSRRLLRTTALVTDIRVAAGRRASVGGLDGYELNAVGRDEETGDPVVLYQLLLLHEQGYYRVVGQAAKADREILDAFRTTARTLREAP